MDRGRTAKPKLFQKLFEEMCKVPKTYSIDSVASNNVQINCFFTKDIPKMVALFQYPLGQLLPKFVFNSSRGGVRKR